MPNIKLDQKIVAIYTVIGLAAGIISNYLTGNSVILAMILPLILYFITLIPLVKKTGEKRRKRIVLNSFLTLFLMWATVWIFLYNL